MFRRFDKTGRSDGGREDYYEEDREDDDHSFSMTFESPFGYLGLGLGMTIR